MRYLMTALILALIAFSPLFAPLDMSTALAPVGAQDVVLQNPTVRIDPAQSLADVGQTFTTRVMIDQANDLGGFEFALFFVPATVTVDSVTVGDFLGSTGRTAGLLGPNIDNQTGRVNFGAWTLGSAPGPNGTGTLATITLTAQGAGISPLDLQDVRVLDTKARGKTPTVEDGLVVVGNVPTSSKIYLPLVLKGW
ncbi:MAG: hypothetical protein FJ014_15275 [Chloroflexi bacterium]|nr:hypothetical protein [Chloroflexota bacterium]